MYEAIDIDWPKRDLGFDMDGPKEQLPTSSSKTCLATSCSRASSNLQDAAKINIESTGRPAVICTPPSRRCNAPSYLYPHRCFTDIFKVFKVAKSMFSGGVSPCATTLQAKQYQRTIPKQGYQIELSTCSVQQNVTNEAAHTYAIGREPCLLRYMLLQSFPRWVTSRYNTFGWRHFQRGALRTSMPIAAPRCAQKHNRLDAYCG
jgi:hypothetical protein